MKIISDTSIHNFEKIKLFLIYQFKYEQHPDLTRQIKEELIAKKIMNDKIAQLSDLLLSYAGKNFRKCDLFSDKDIMNLLSKKYNQIMKKVPNIYTQHVPYLTKIIKSAKENRLKETEYKFYQSQFMFQGAPQEIIVLQVGGTTFEEAREVAAMNQAGDKILLVGTYIHNSKTFLAEFQGIVE